MIWALLILFFILIFLGVPIAISLGATGAIWLISEASIPDVVLATKIFASTDSFALMAIPFFMMAGEIMDRTGITQQIITFSRNLVGHIRGGLAHTTCLAEMVLSGVSGSGNADTAAIGTVMIPALKDEGYDEGFAVALVAAAGSLGPIIPPSVCMIIYANAANYSVGKLFIGGILPGIVIGLSFMVISYIYARRHNIGGYKFVGWKTVWQSFVKAFGALIMPIIIIGGIVTGIFTATEAGVAAIIYGLIFGAFKKRLSFQMLKESLLQSVVASLGPMMIIAYSSILGYALTRLNMANMVADFCAKYVTTEFGLLLVVIIISVIAGCFIDCAATMLMLLPILIPTVNAMGIDFQFFSIVFILALNTSLITPPVGALLFVASAIGETPVQKTIKSIGPFILVSVLAIFIVILFPSLATWLPDLFY
jgi:tripartite ATP-independent transporter DctM subunit